MTVEDTCSRRFDENISTGMRKKLKGCAGILVRNFEVLDQIDPAKAVLIKAYNWGQPKLGS